MAEAIGSRKRVLSGPFVASGQRPTQALVVSFPPDRRNYADMIHPTRRRSTDACEEPGGFFRPPQNASSSGFQSAQLPNSAESWTMAPRREQKITIRQMREMGVRGLLIYCSDYKCTSAAIPPRSTATDGPMRCGDPAIRHRAAFHLQSVRQEGAGVRPDFNWDKKQPVTAMVRSGYCRCNPPP
jgi:hypothetical protein